MTTIKKIFAVCSVCCAICAVTNSAHAQWMPDNGDGTYTNPIIDADYSDPDVCRRGDDFYLISSNFNAVPGPQILHSRDLVNWRIVGVAMPSLAPAEKYDTPKHGLGVYAPAIRCHNDSLYIYWPDPDAGIYMVKAKDPEGPWTAPVMVKAGAGYIDPCPLWDDDGKAYLVHALAGSRTRIGSVLVMNRLSPDGTHVLDGQGRTVYDGRSDGFPVVEGPKLYKRDGWYWIFAPGGGVGQGYQIAMRSRDIYGPYESRVVLASDKGTINGPHQGAWVDTPDGREDWFIHFQHKKPIGRVTHLEPMTWTADGWPVIGQRTSGFGKVYHGERLDGRVMSWGIPVTQHKKPNVGRQYESTAPQTSDTFDSRTLGLQWQWSANPKSYWYYCCAEQSLLRLQCVPQIGDRTADAKPGPDNYNLAQCPNLLLQKFPAQTFETTAQVTLYDGAADTGKNERGGLVVFGGNYASLTLTLAPEGLQLQVRECTDAIKSPKKPETLVKAIDCPVIQRPTDTKGHPQAVGHNAWLRVNCDAKGRCTFSYSWDGKKFQAIDGYTFQAVEGKWMGAKIGLFCNRPWKGNGGLYMDVHDFQVKVKR